MPDPKQTPEKDPVQSPRDPSVNPEKVPNIDPVQYPKDPEVNNPNPNPNKPPLRS